MLKGAEQVLKCADVLSVPITPAENQMNTVEAASPLV